MADYFFNIAGQFNAHFQTPYDIENPRKNLLQLGAHTPGLTLLRERPDYVDLILRHEFADAASLEDGHSHITLKTPPADKMPADIPHLLYGAARRILARRGFYCVHAACVGTENDFTLLTGPSGSGKTTTAHRLVEQHGLKLLSGNKTVVRVDENGSMYAIAGTKTMTALDENLRRYEYEMDAAQYAEGPQKISSIALIRVNDGVREFENLKPLSALHKLYPLFSDAVNSDIIISGTDLLNGRSSDKVQKALLNDLSRSLPKMKLAAASGPFDFLMQKARSL